MKKNPTVLPAFYFKEHALQVTGLCNVSGGMCFSCLGLR